MHFLIARKFVTEFEARSLNEDKIQSNAERCKFFFRIQKKGKKCETQSYELEISSPFLPLAHHSEKI